MKIIPDSWQDLNLSSLSITILGKKDRRESIGAEPRPDRVVRAEQVHRDEVCLVDDQSLGREIPKVDGLVTLEPNIWLQIRVADCIPVFLFDKDIKVVGLSHLGRKGLLKGQIEKFISKALRVGGFDKNDLYLILGPSIGGCCYQVNSGTAKRFIKRFPDKKEIITTHVDIKLDLRSAAAKALEEAGISQDHVWSPLVCTKCQRDNYYSFQGSGWKITKRNLCLIAKTR